MAGDGIQMDRRIRRTADGRIDENDVLEGFAGHDLRGAKVLKHDLYGPHTGVIGDLATFAVGRGDRGAAGQRHAERLGQ